MILWSIKKNHISTCRKIQKLFRTISTYILYRDRILWLVLYMFESCFPFYSEAQKAHINRRSSNVLRRDEIKF
jgi:hypothetical protein